MQYKASWTKSSLLLLLFVAAAAAVAVVVVVVVTVAIGTKREAVTGDRGELHNEQLHCLCCSVSIIQVFKSGRIRWVGHGAYGTWHMWGEKGNVYRILVGKLDRKGPLFSP
jgi:hypothetical protein